MPTYEYRCKSCQHTFEEFQSITAKPLRRCPECGKRVERLMGTGAGIIFKGSGFYCTDYRSDSYRQKAKGESSSSSSASSDSGGGAKAKDGEKAAPAAKAGSGKKAKSEK